MEREKEEEEEACVTCGDALGETEGEGEAGSPRVCLLCLGAACFEGWEGLRAHARECASP